ncbi:MAG: TonB family protein [Polyangiaceae bacterium]
MKALGVSAIGVSAVFHAALLLLLFGHRSTSRGRDDDDAVVDVAADLLPSPDVPTPDPIAIPPADHAARWSTRAHPGPISPHHERTPHDPIRVHAIVHTAIPTHTAPALAPSAEVANDDMPRFVLAVGPASTQSYGALSPSGNLLASDLTSAPMEEWGVDAPARALSRIAPSYPDAARSAGIEGDVRLELVVGASGEVESARVIRGVAALLDEAALRAVRQFRFAPATKGGRAVRVRMSWTMQFRLQ